MNTSTLRRPGWASQLRRKTQDEDIPDQITIIRKGNGSIPQPIHAGNGEMSMSGESRYTGDGEDNMLQPGKVAGDVHEGEMVFSANATQAFPPDVLQALNTQAESGTLDVQAIRQALKIPAQQGYATGSFGSPIEIERDANKYPFESLKIAQPISVPAPTPIIQSIPSAPQTPQVAKTIEAPKTANIITANQTPAPVIQPIGVPSVSTVAKTITTDQTPAAITPITVPSATNAADEQAKLDQRGIQIGAAQNVAANATTPAVAVTATTPATTTPAQPSKYQTAYDTSLTRLQDVAGGNSEIDRNIANRNLRLYDTTASNDIAVADQQAALQNNIPESARDALGAEARSSVRSGRSELIGTLAQSEQERALNANQTAATLAYQGMQFEEDKKRYGDDLTWKGYDAAIAAGDFDTAAAQYKAITGKDISMNEMKTYQNYKNTKQSQDLTAGDLANDASKLNLTTAKMQSMISDINNGVPLATINSTYGTTLDQTSYNSIGEKYNIGMSSLRTTLGTEKLNAISDAIGKGASLEQINTQFPEAKLSLDQYKTMYEATPLGERTWERNMSYAKTLLEAGGSSNITAAAGIFDQAFPGTNIDFTKLITADNAATVNKGMSQLSDLVAAGMDYDEAIAVMKKNGTLDMLGMSETEVESVYRGMKVNAIDEQWNEIVESDFFKGLTPEQQKDMKTFQAAVLTGELDYSVQKEYTYTDAAGKTVTKRFKTEGEAAAFATQNKVTLSAARDVVVPRTSTTTDETDDTSVSPPSGRTEPLGTTIIEGGKIYQVIADGKTQEIVPDVGEPLSDNNLLIMKAGEANNPYYKTLVDEAYKAVSGGNDLTKLNASYVAGTNYNLNQFNNTFSDYKDIPFENPVIQRLKKDIETGSGDEATKLTIVKDGNSWKITRA